MTRYLILATAALAACSGPGSDRAMPADSSHVLAPPPSAAGDSALSGFIHGALIPTGWTRAELSARLGAPDSVQARTVANRHDQSVTDSVLTLHYPGLVAEIYRAGYDGKEILASLRISDDAHLSTTSPIRLGASADAVRDALGEPTSASDSVMVYECDECLVTGHETIRFILARNAVRRVDVQYWVD